ncbi:unnamed protein product [Cuscuta epithymum]|uniref:Uncharacterized protein n=1 Tax=Cuscuta epithymum TaxID=186058 RepID=A0AAV0G2I9_9ASTE|nr:unnamed protein product [Cuscuta epithymum]
MMLGEWTLLFHQMKFSYFYYVLLTYLYFVFSRSNIKGDRFLVCFILIASFLVRGNQADAAVNSLKALTFSAISLAPFGVDYSIFDKEVKGQMGLWLGWFRRRLALDDYFTICNFPMLLRVDLI